MNTAFSSGVRSSGEEASRLAKSNTQATERGSSSPSRRERAARTSRESWTRRLAAKGCWRLAGSAPGFKASASAVRRSASRWAAWASARTSPVPRGSCTPRSGST